MQGVEIGHNLIKKTIPPKRGVGIEFGRKKKKRKKEKWKIGRRNWVKNARFCKVKRRTRKETRGFSGAPRQIRGSNGDENTLSRTGRGDDSHPNREGEGGKCPHKKSRMKEKCRKGGNFSKSVKGASAIAPNRGHQVDQADFDKPVDGADTHHGAHVASIRSKDIGSASTVSIGTLRPQRPSRHLEVEAESSLGDSDDGLPEFMSAPWRAHPEDLDGGMSHGIRDQYRRFVRHIGDVLDDKERPDEEVFQAPGVPKPIQIMIRVDLQAPGHVLTRSFLVPALVDSGQNMSHPGILLSKEFAEQAGFDLKGLKEGGGSVGTAKSGSDIPILGKLPKGSCKLIFPNIEKSFVVQPWVLPGLNHQVNVGAAFLKMVGAQIDFQQETINLPYLGAVMPFLKRTDDQVQEVTAALVSPLPELDVPLHEEEVESRACKSSETGASASAASIPDYVEKLKQGDPGQMSQTIDLITLEAVARRNPGIFTMKMPIPPPMAGHKMLMVEDVGAMETDGVEVLSGIVPPRQNEDGIWEVEVVLCAYHPETYVQPLSKVAEVTGLTPEELVPKSRSKTSRVESMSNPRYTSGLQVGWNDVDGFPLGTEAKPVEIPKVERIQQQLDQKSQEEKLESVIQALRLEDNPCLKVGDRLQRVKQMVAKYQHAFVTEDARVGHVDNPELAAALKLKTGVKPVCARPRPMHPTMQDALDAQVQEWLADGVIRPSTSPWSSPIVPVKKKDGRTRFC
ncbi:MAG: hypothetical protein L7S67_10215, partial [Flavobacteriales bacterium]|nr:hypothetical protein [Flavobacteriales bacterium]